MYKVFSLQTVAWSIWAWKCLAMDGLGFLLDAPYIASPHHELDAPILSLDAHHMVLDGLVLSLGFHDEVSLAFFHQPWSHLSLPSNLASGNFVPSTVFPTRGYRGATPSAPYLGGASSWRRLILTTPPPGDALLLATPHFGDASSSFLGPLAGSHRIFDSNFDLDFGRRPGTGRYSSKIGE